MEDDKKQPKENLIKALDQNLRKSRGKQYVKMFEYLPIISNCIIFTPVVYVAMAGFLVSNGKLVNIQIENELLFVFSIIVIAMSFAARSFFSSYFHKKEKNGETITIQEMFQFHVLTLSALSMPSFAGFLLSILSGNIVWGIVMAAISIISSLMLKPDITKFESYNEVKEEYDL